MNSLEIQVQVANTSQIYECDASTICDAIFFDLEQVGHHRSAKHHKLISGYSQKLYVSDAYNEQVNLGMRNQTEYMSRDETHFSEPSNRST